VTASGIEPLRQKQGSELDAMRALSSWSHTKALRWTPLHRPSIWDTAWLRLNATTCRRRPTICGPNDHDHHNHD